MKLRPLHDILKKVDLGISSYFFVIKKEPSKESCTIAILGLLDWAEIILYFEHDKKRSSDSQSGLDGAWMFISSPDKTP